MGEGVTDMVDPRTIFEVDGDESFTRLALTIFRYQAVHCGPYREYLQLLGVDPSGIHSLEEIPFLPVELFKTCRIYAAESEPEQIFTSSSTSGQEPSKHYVASLALYEEAFTRAFEHFYGPAEQVALFALLPSYLEREGSSLIYMADRLIARGGGGFYLHDHEKLLQDLASCHKKKILLGVSYALWDLAEQHPGPLRDTIVMETGGMKGKRRELPREEFHDLLQKAFGVSSIHSEYGMAELMSQAYSSGQGLFYAPSWMRVLIRDLNDPFEILPPGRTGGVNLIDLANLYSCSFLQTADLGVTRPDEGFRILGRISGSEIRGCNLLVQ